VVKVHVRKNPHRFDKFHDVRRKIRVAGDLSNGRGDDPNSGCRTTAREGKLNRGGN
jgi:hypothetical protein